MDGFDLYQAIGGTATCRRLAEVFYARVKRDPVLRPLFPGKTLKCAIEEFSAFLAQLLGGPAEDAQRRWWLSLRESHRRFKIGQTERTAWMENMLAALDEVPLEESARRALRDFFDRSSAYVAKDVPAGPIADDAGGPPGDNIHQELSRRWSAQRTLDEAVAAVHGGAAERAVALAEGSTLQGYFERNQSVLAALLAQMIAWGDDTLLDWVRHNLLAHPGLAQERYSGRTLLHAAAAAGNVAMVELLLHLGADPNVTDGGSHTPLYSVANQCKMSGAANVVHTLVQAGARVDACDGVKRCTALHMAARRDNVEVAAALLDNGAELEARDSLGETPLRRAVNCNKTAVARLLLARGSDLQSKGSKGLDPLLAARTTAMRQLLQSHRQT
ncbi:MAG TPA: ankyrin repeat domain-containing protein [Chloroflexota bacterium]|nr:ankyrin repeat domain-containing protein [Chloroflexota bacterium]